MISRALVESDLPYEQQAGNQTQSTIITARHGTLQVLLPPELAASSLTTTTHQPQQTDMPDNAFFVQTVAGPAAQTAAPQDMTDNKWVRLAFFVTLGGCGTALMRPHSGRVRGSSRFGCRRNRGSAEYSPLSSPTQQLERGGELQHLNRTRTQFLGCAEKPGGADTPIEERYTYAYCCVCIPIVPRSKLLPLWKRENEYDTAQQEEMLEELMVKLKAEVYRSMLSFGDVTV